MRPINDHDRLRRFVSMEECAARASAAECDHAGAPDAAGKFRDEAEVLDRQVVRSRGQAHVEDRRWRQRDPEGYQVRGWLAEELATAYANRTKDPWADWSVQGVRSPREGGADPSCRTCGGRGNVRVEVTPSFWELHLGACDCVVALSMDGRYPAFTPERQRQRQLQRQAAGQPAEVVGLAGRGRVHPACGMVM